MTFHVLFATTKPTETYPLSLHDALPIFLAGPALIGFVAGRTDLTVGMAVVAGSAVLVAVCARWISWKEQGKEDRKSTRLNSSHLVISYAVFCLKKKRTANTTAYIRTTET